MRKTTLVVDDERLARAAAVLGTRGLKETIDRALDEVIANAARHEALQQMHELQGLELNDARVMDQAWR